MMVDDAHSSGVLGRNGRGTIDHFNVHGRVDIQVGTLSKAIGALGGYVCGTRDLIEFLYHRGRPFLFSTSHPPSVAATCIAAFDVLEQEPERIEKLWENTRYWKKELGALGFNIGGVNTPASETPITPIIIGDGRLTMDFSRELFKEGVLGTGIAFPDGAGRQGAHPHHHDRDAHARRARSGAGNAEASGQADGDPRLMASAIQLTRARQAGPFSFLWRWSWWALFPPALAALACAVPWLLAHSTAIGLALQRSFSLVCHQQPERSFVSIRRKCSGMRTVPWDLSRRSGRIAAARAAAYRVALSCRRGLA